MVYDGVLEVVSLSPMILGNVGKNQLNMVLTNKYKYYVNIV